MNNSFRKGVVVLVGRPNVGKSTVLNGLVGQKVSIVTDKPQTTRSQITAYYEDSRGQIFFVDTPGFYLGKRNSTFPSVIRKALKEADIVLYIVDQTRDWGEEDERLWRIIEESPLPVVLVINKLDITKHDYSETYDILIGKHAKNTIRISALKQQHLQSVINIIFDMLPEGERDTTVDFFPSHLLSQTGPEFLAEIIREKIFEKLGEEIPYLVSVRVTNIDEDEDKNRLRISGALIVPETRYKPIVIGANGAMIREIRMATEKELTVATNKEVRVNLTVMTTDEFQD